MTAQQTSTTTFSILKDAFVLHGHIERQKTIRLYSSKSIIQDSWLDLSKNKVCVLSKFTESIKLSGRFTSGSNQIPAMFAKMVCFNLKIWPITEYCFSSAMKP